MISSACFLLSLAILYYVIRYRVHVHLHFEISNSRSSAWNRRRETGERQGPCCETRKPERRVEAMLVASDKVEPIAMTRSGQTPDSVVWGDIASGLVNLGAKKGAAEKAARKAVQQHPDASFDIQFSVALQEVWRVA